MGWMVSSLLTLTCLTRGGGLQVLSMLSILLSDECQILCIWTPWFALVRPLALLFSNVLVSFCIFYFCRTIRERNGKFHKEMTGNSEILKSRSIELKIRSIETLPEVDRSKFSRNCFCKARQNAQSEAKKQSSLWFSLQNTLVSCFWLSLAAE
jgi:hypothetical protein